jgi:cytochrome c oxidase subunit 3
MQSIRNINLTQNEQHPFHLCVASLWPIFTSFALLLLALQFVGYFHYYRCTAYAMPLFLFTLSIVLSRWFSDITTEARYEGHHTSKVQQNILLGMMLFITSEIMFFFAFFWAFFHFSLTPSIFIGGVWPPKGIHPLWFTALPLLNTVLLLSSGVTLTFAHRAVAQGRPILALHGIAFTIVYGIIFTLLQKVEYDSANFSINDSVYGSIFYMTTGFHGLHVIIGTLFLFICFIRGTTGLVENHHTGFVCAVWYWHFVDIVWIFLFLCVYIWGA